MEELEHEKQELESRALQLRTEVELLSRVCADLETDENREWAELSNTRGIQQCCYRVLVEEAKPLTAISIRYQLELRGVSWITMPIHSQSSTRL